MTHPIAMVDDFQRTIGRRMVKDCVEEHANFSSMAFVDHLLELGA
jgi:hypothetical protein